MAPVKIINDEIEVLYNFGGKENVIIVKIKTIPPINKPNLRVCLFGSRNCIIIKRIKPKIAE